MSAQTSCTRLIAVVAAVALSLGLHARGESGSWVLNANGNWSVAGNWAGSIVADGAGFTAWLTNNITTATRVVTIDTTPRTLGVLEIGDADGTHAFTLAASGGARLTFNNDGSTARLDQIASSRGDTISAPLAISDSLVVANASTNSLTISGAITGSVAAVRTLTNAGAGIGGVTFSGVIGNGIGTVAVVQNSGLSVLTLSGANTYTGGTTVAAGTLRVANATGSATGPGQVAIGSGATLELAGALSGPVNNGGTIRGNGTLSGSVTHQHDGILSPGFPDTTGATLTVGNLTWNGGGVFVCKIASLDNNEAGAGLDYDQVRVSGTLTAVPGGSNLVIRMDSLGQTLDFETNRNYSLKVMTCGTATVDPADVTLDTNDFRVGGAWSVTNLNNSLYVVCLGAPVNPNKNYWRGTGNWSTATNWSLGHAPLPGEEVEFDFMGAANCTADAVSNGLGSLTVAAGYTGTVTFLTKFPGKGDFTTVSISGDCTINGGALSHGANTTDELYRLALSAGGNLTIASGATIHADGMGYNANQGPGKPAVSFAGGSYGGKGGQRFSTPASIGPTYGSIVAPTNLGSGGSNYKGGGCVQLAVGGTAAVYGVISAMGAGGGTYEGGSGGSVFLTTGVLTGNGTLRVNGGSVTAGSSGGGGRIAVVLTNSLDFGAVVMQAFAGAPAFVTGGAGGTVYLEHTNHPAGQGKLIVDYNGVRAYLGYTVQNGKDESAYRFSEIVLTNAAVYELDANDTLDITGTAISGGSVNRYEGILLTGGTLTVPAAFAFSNYFVTVNTANSTFNPTASLTVGPLATLKFDVPWTVDYPIVLENGGWLSHSPNSTTALGELYKLNLTVNGNLNIQTGGQVNVDGMGYSSKNGPGAAVGNAGGSHAGRGGTRGGTPGTTYGSLTAPTNFGSGGGGFAGGGCALLTVTGTTTVNGAISASGGGGGNYDSGAGGSVLLTTGALEGNGVIRADGGDVIYASSGGGGRVAVVLTNSTDFGAIRFQAVASFSTDVRRGAGGTVYLTTQAQEPGGGLLILDASNRVATLSTLISSNVTDTVVGTVILTNGAIFQIDTNQSLTVNGSWTNAATFIAVTNSTVVFASAVPVTIAGSSTFGNLIITNAGKTVSFQAGKTNTVNGLLKLGVTGPAPLVTLQSTSPDSPWYLTLTGGGAQEIDKVRVTDSDAGGGQLLTAGKGSVNGGNNVNWFFPKSGGTVIIVR